jgi:hypothetical protein
MDVLSQAMSVVEHAEAGSGRITLTLDLDEPAQRAAFAAAVAVLRINGVDLPELHAAVLDSPALQPAPQGSRGSAAPDSSPESTQTAGDDARQDDPVRRSYREAISELTPDKARSSNVVRDTYPRIEDLLRSGANVEAVAQIQYRRWVEEHLDSIRN